MRSVTFTDSFTVIIIIGMDVTDEMGHYSAFLANGSASFVQTPMMGSPRSPEELKLQLRQQLEYYFSRCVCLCGDRCYI